MCSIVAFGTVEPGQILNISASEALPRSGQILLYAQQVNGRPSCGGTEGLPGYLTAEGVLLEIEEPGSTLDVGQGRPEQD